MTDLFSYLWKRYWSVCEKGGIQIFCQPVLFEKSYFPAGSITKSHFQWWDSNSLWPISFWNRDFGQFLNYFAPKWGDDPFFGITYLKPWFWPIFVSSQFSHTLTSNTSRFADLKKIAWDGSIELVRIGWIPPLGKC